MSEHAPEPHPKYGAVEDYARGEIRAYHGIVNTWLLVVYLALALWGIYYLLKYWGGLGPGLAVGQLGSEHERRAHPDPPGDSQSGDPGVRDPLQRAVGPGLAVVAVSR